MSPDIIVIGAGPAGMAAATTAAEAGAQVLVLDDQPAPGGQIYRAIERAGDTAGDVLGAEYLAGKPLAEAMRAELNAPERREARDFPMDEHLAQLSVHYAACG